MLYEGTAADATCYYDPDGTASDWYTVDVYQGSECTEFACLATMLGNKDSSGAPKVKAMQIIDNLEKQKRGLYGGTVGYLAFSGNIDTCIAIRTVLFKNNKAYVQAGAGVGVAFAALVGSGVGVTCTTLESSSLPPPKLHAVMETDNTVVKANNISTLLFFIISSLE